MFYSEQLLAKTGPLARVWLAANVERKLSKSQILQSDIESSVGAIVDRGHEPMALRLSGQLMLGVVRIYGRKARYLLDDCNEALIKIRMTFKSTNSHDLPAHATTALDLNLPELLTIDDLFSNMDFSFSGRCWRRFSIITSEKVRASARTCPRRTDQQRRCHQDVL